ncbi:TetR/AcrR family transcriptional regulator [Paraburkholderia sp. USG1]|uniref:TetR/AcrR family transcriptional regulator n=1 Tax=Paraburkholderia sp. USG1 TaxID=2952268 RepID=UPI00285E6AD7|nr:TetR/AcrR family transcriptional regulator [Paraburkholderia sp. USG1]MDR8398356.1 TetR/AcrR family transcriptional regulator [Paraburkholderia sp. USG1]
MILDAAAQVIIEEGLAGMTMHGVARRAKTSIGSMYYFFPDRDSLLQALVDRHVAATREIGRDLNTVPASTWRQFSATEAIGRMITPYIEYLRRHADYLPLMHGRTQPEDDADFVHTVRRVLDARLPGVEPAGRQAYATLLHSIAAGTVHMAFQVAPEGVCFFLQEIPRVMAAYLADIEGTVRS